MTDLSSLSLEDLFAEAKAAVKAKRKADFLAKEKRAAEPEPPAIAFGDPVNWVEGTGVALIHRETQTFLGNFRSYRHKSDPEIRRLVRSEEPIAVSGVEEVDFGYTPPETPISSPRAETQAFLTVDLELDTPLVSARHVLVCVHYHNGWTARVVLVEPTTFAEQGEILQLPAGVDVLPALSRASKQAVRHQ